MHFDSILIVGVAKTLEEKMSIVVVQEEGLFLISSGKNMVIRAGIFDPELPSQGPLS
jgi:hypothetical protein